MIRGGRRGAVRTIPYSAVEVLGGESDRENERASALGMLLLPWSSLNEIAISKVFLCAKLSGVPANLLGAISSNPGSQDITHTQNGACLVITSSRIKP